MIRLFAVAWLQLQIRLRMYSPTDVIADNHRIKGIFLIVHENNSRNLYALTLT